MPCMPGDCPLPANPTSDLLFWTHHLQAILSKQRAETLSSVLYPDDRTYEGKELRLKQQHFFVSATVQVRGVASGGLPRTWLSIQQAREKPCV